MWKETIYKLDITSSHVTCKLIKRLLFKDADKY